MENTKKKPTVDSFWHELTGAWPVTRLQFTSAKIDKPVPFMGSKKQISFRRHTPMEHFTGHPEPDIAKEDWTRPHD
jgi:hypothetical protein